MNVLTGRKLALLLFGAALTASVSFGSWKVWSDAQPLPPAPASSLQSLPIAQIDSAPQNDETPVTPTAKVETPPAKKVELPTLEEVRIKELPTGKKHAKQDELLALMAQRLHSDAYTKFISQPGMGMSRMMPTLRIVPREWKMPEWTSEEITKEQPPKTGMKDLSLIHRLNLNQFSASNIPLEKASKNEQPPALSEQVWEIHSLDLVGLVMHDTAKVYVSKKLPEMKDLKNTPIRDLDVFESEGLEELVGGKDLYVRAKEGTIRVLGPIRASKACLKCHGDAKDGDMLGAFSYTLREARYEHGFRGGNAFQPAFKNGIKGNSLPMQQVQP